MFKDMVYKKVAEYIGVGGDTKVKCKITDPLYASLQADGVLEVLRQYYQQPEITRYHTNYLVLEDIGGCVSITADVKGDTAECTIIVNPIRVHYSEDEDGTVRKVATWHEFR